MPMLPLVIQIERTQERLADTCAFAHSPVRIGRNPLSDLQLDESFVSHWHSVISFDEEHTTYLDLGSTNPTVIDGRPIARNAQVEVTENTDIRIGSLRLHVLRVPAPPELFCARRKTSFARADASSSDSMGATTFAGDVPSAAPVKAQTQEALTRSAARSAGASSHPPGLTATGVVERDRYAASGELPIYEGASLEALFREYAGARAELVRQLHLQLEAAPPGEREALCDSWFERHPELAHEGSLRELLGKLGVATWRTGVPDTTDWLRRLTGGLFPPPAQHTPVNNALALERIGEVLEVFSSAFIELRTARAQMCEELALDKPHHDSLLHATHDPRALLAYLLNPDTTHCNKLTDLARALADFAIHPVALLSAMVEGAREVLQTLSPTALTGRGERPGASFFGKMLGAEQKELWTRYVDVFDQTIDGERFTRKLFGPSFARKYYAITGARRSLPSPARTGSSVRP